MAAVVVFGFAGASFPDLDLPRLDARRILDSDWFKLAKDTGLVYVSLVLPVVALSTYFAIVQTVGRFFVGILLIASQPTLQGRKYRLVTAKSLVPLAQSLERSHFTLDDLTARAGELAGKYQSSSAEMWKGFQESMTRLTKNFQEYLGCFLALLVAWLVLFTVAGSGSWPRANVRAFWPTVFWLILLAAFAWFRVRRAFALIPGMLLIWAAYQVSRDPDMASLLSKSPSETKSVELRLEELLRAEQASAERLPSLSKFLRYRLGMLDPSEDDPRSEPLPARRFAAARKSLKERRQARTARNMRIKTHVSSAHRPSAALSHQSSQADLPNGWAESLYARGVQFRSNTDRNQAYDDDWLSGYGAYTYVRFVNWYATLARVVWNLMKFTVTGA